MSYTVREAVRADLPVVSQMAAEMIRQHHEADPMRFFVIEGQEKEYEEYLTGELRDTNAVVFVAEEGKDIIGYVYARVEPRNWYELVDEHGRLHDVFVAKDFRGLGIGKALIKVAADYLVARGMKIVVATIRSGNEASIGAFDSCGWKPTMTEMTFRLEDGK